MTKKEKHKRIWFLNRVGEYIVRNNTVDLLNPPIKIESSSHAKALYISQSEKNYSYHQ